MMTKKEREEEILNKLDLKPKRERDLHREIGIDNSLCSKLLKSLESQGLIKLEKSIIKGQRNSKHIILTDEGKKYKKLEGAVEEIKIPKYNRKLVLEIYHKRVKEQESEMIEEERFDEFSVENEVLRKMRGEEW